MWYIPPSIWAATPKDAWWWMAMTPYDDPDDSDPLDYIYDNDSPCPGHGYVVEDDDTGDLEFCDGSCVTEKESR